MSKVEIVQVVHEFAPATLKKLVKKALKNRSAFVIARKDKMVSICIQHRQEWIDFNALPWYKRWRRSGFRGVGNECWEGEVLSLEEATRVVYDDYDEFCDAGRDWRWAPDGHRYDPLIYGSRYAELKILEDEILRGSDWVEEIERLDRNLKNPGDKISVSAMVLSSIRRWAAHDNPLEP